MKHLYNIKGRNVQQAMGHLDLELRREIWDGSADVGAILHERRVVKPLREHEQ